MAQQKLIFVLQEGEYLPLKSETVAFIGPPSQYRNVAALVYFYNRPDAESMLIISREMRP